MSSASQRIGHPLEEQMNASAWDILDAIANGFRVQIDVRGKLAELYVYKRLLTLAEHNVIAALQWLDIDGEPDFRLTYKGHHFRIECKNVRGKDAVYRRGEFKVFPQVELQKTRTGTDPKTGANTRGYSVTHFDVLAACLFNQIGRWEFLFTSSSSLERREDNPNLLKIFQPVPRTPQGPWVADIIPVLDALLSSKKHFPLRTKT